MIMSLHRRIIHSCSIFLMLSGFIHFIALDAWANDAAVESLREQDFSWYDSSNDQFKPISIPDYRWLDDWFASESSNDSASGDFSSTAVRVLLWTLVIIMAITLIVFLIRAFIDIPLPAPPENLSRGPRISKKQLEALPEVAREITDFLAETRRLAKQGDFSQAMIYFYSWQLITLDDHDVIELQNGKTNRQYLQESKKNCPSILKSFKDSIKLFEDSIYGGIVLTKDQFQNVWDNREHFLQGAKTSSTIGGQR